jgi:hypothetical protein
MIKIKLLEIIFSKTAIGIAIGLIGSLIMIYLMTDPFNLYYIGGYLLLIGMILIVFGATSIFIIVGKGQITYWNKVYVGFLAFFSMEIILRIYQVINKAQEWKLNTTQLIGSTILILILGFILSLLFARMKNKENTPNKR